jgi:hypothetical protein
MLTFLNSCCPSLRIAIFLCNLLLLLSPALYSEIAASIPEQYLVRIDNPDPKLEKELQSYDLAGYKPGAYLDVIISDNQLQQLRLLAPHARIITSRSEETIRRQDRALSGYQDYAAVVAEMQQLAANYPTHCQLIDLGPTWGEIYSDQGYSNYDNSRHHIWAMKVSDNAMLEEDEPGFYFVGAHHAREPMTTKICMRLLNNLLSQYNIDPEITNAVNNRQIWILPILNPDGYQVVQDSFDVWWRKNFRDNNGNHAFDTNHQTGAVGADGVDLNRNYGFYWWSPGGSSNPVDATYRGPAADSEPEMQAMENLIRAHHIVGGISYHSYGEQVIYPWTDFNNNPAPDNAVFTALGAEMAAAIPGEYGGTYQPFNFGIVYGSVDMWAYANEGVLGFLIECGNSFIADSTSAENVAQSNQQAPFVLMERFDRAVLKGIVTDAQTGLPLEATIIVEGIDDQPSDRLPYRSDDNFGRYYRALQPQTYTVRFFRYGYHEQTIRDVVISANQPTILNVQMQPYPLVNISGTVMNAYGDMLPMSNIIILSQDNQTAVTDANGSFSLQDFPVGQHMFRVQSEGYGMREFIIDVSPNSNDLVFVLYMPVYADGFEADNQAWSRTGMWARTSVNPHLGNICLTDSPGVNYANSGTSYARLNTPLNLSQATYAGVSFWVNYSFPDPLDWCLFSVSTDNQNWMPVDGFHTIQSEWSMVNIDLSMFCGESSLYFQFQMQTDASLNGEGINIDDFCLYTDTPLVLIRGDVDGDGIVTLADAQIAVSYAAGCNPLTIDPIPWEAGRILSADVDGDGAVTGFDGTLIARFAEGLIIEFPCADPDYQPPYGSVSTVFSDNSFQFTFWDEPYGFDLAIYTPYANSFGDVDFPNGGEGIMAASWNDGIYKAALARVGGLQGWTFTVPFSAEYPLRENIVVYYRINGQAGEWSADLVSNPDEPLAPLPAGITNVYPNPFNPQTRIDFNLPVASDVELCIYNVRGQKVKTVVNADLLAGRHSVTWYGDNDNHGKAASGIYMCKLSAGGKTYLKKLMLTK